MAGERIGKTYEALLKVVLDAYCEKKHPKSRVFWNETPEGLSVEPDFLIGSDKDHPEIVFMVTHSGSSKESEKKCWRNIGELCEVKTVLDPAPLAVNIVFDSVMKNNLKLLQAAAFDGQLIIGDQEYGNAITKWVKQHEKDLPVNQDEKAKCITDLLSSDGQLSTLISKVVTGISQVIQSSQTDLNDLWSLEKQRPRETPPKAKSTFFRRGFTKRLLVGEAIQNKKVSKKDALWLVPLGIVTSSTAGYRISDPDLSWFLRSELAKDYHRIGDICSTNGFKWQIQKVRSFTLLKEYGKFVIDNYKLLTDVEGMLNCMETLSDNPSTGLTIPTGTPPPQNIWIYDYIAALSKAATGKSQSFGYSIFANHTDGTKIKIGNMTIGQWCSHFAGEYFNRKKMSIPPEAKKHIAQILSEQLRQFDTNTVASLQTKIEEMYINKEFKKILLTHRGFEPLLALLIEKKVIPSRKAKQNIRTCFAEKAKLTGQTGETAVTIVKNTLINWQTGTDAGKDHKRKELCGRAVGLRYSWDSAREKFIKRPGIEKLILLLDGTWRQKDLDVLIASGWDEIYYPDEIDKLKAAIV